MPPVVRYKDPYNPVLLNSKSLEVSIEQNGAIMDVLEIACSDSRFTAKSYTAILRILTAGSVVRPVLSSINPTTGVVNELVEVTATGTGFGEGSAILVGRQELPTTRISDTELRAEHMPLVEGNKAVSVISAESVISNPLNFTVTSVVGQEKSEKEKSHFDRVMQELKDAHAVQERSVGGPSEARQIQKDEETKLVVPDDLKDKEKTVEENKKHEDEEYKSHFEQK